MNPPTVVLPEWEVPAAVPVVTQEPLQSLLRELLSRDIINLKTLIIVGLLFTLLILWRQTRRPSKLG